MTDSPSFTAPQIMHDFLHEASSKGGYRLLDTPKTGWYARSLSQKAEKDGQFYWLQIRRPLFKGYTSWQAANAVHGVTKPALLHHETAQLIYPDDVSHDNLTDTASEQNDSHFMIFSYCDDTPVSPRAWQVDDFIPEHSWWHGLQQSLEAIQKSSTNICAISDTFIREQLKKHFAFEPASPLRRHVVHGDLHWGNLGRDKNTLYDWELYGTGPYGYDISLLYFYSQENDALKQAIEHHFAHMFHESDFYTTLLFTCAAVMRIIPTYPILQRYEQTALDLGALCLQRIS